MTKTRAPVLSLGAHGSVGDRITYRESRHASIAEKKPSLPYSLTLPQQYQRWLYRDYAYLWTQQTAGVKATYATRAARNHTTPIAEWLRSKLATVPDITGWWTLDAVTGGTTPDRSTSQNHATVIGASSLHDAINKALYFDGINDRLTIPYGAVALSGTGPFTIFLFVTIHTLKPTGYGRIVSREIGAISHLLYYIGSGPRYFRAGIPGLTPSFFTHTTALSAGQRYALAHVYDLAHQIIYVDGTPVSVNVTGTRTNYAAPIDVAVDATYALWQNLTVDNLIIFNRALDQAEISRWSARRYP